MSKIKNLIIISALFCLITPVSALAYSYSGYKWFQTPGTIRTVDIDPIGRNTAEELAIRNSMSSWSNAGAKFYYVDTTTSGNDFGYYYEVSNDLAVNRIEINWLGYITRTYVKVNTYHPWATNGDANSYDFESMAAHELGHGLRLLHSSDTAATMYYSMSRGETKKRTLETDDKNGIKYIYGSL
ncbi:matrixin family metalloprotease [Patescibacteria group bacterium]|nr:matrixin family metalloprotease [Patescibacteria group bacterium]MBU4347089.1 matrixin family metalloprotease [Patescibacteria group bacterium]MBU4455696.1 matrixin family metalloprotease [Patescibacteria group bacterium]MCG2691022.1 matrixin family metalloprotease [Candidatus Parcubacteria bacterium]